MNPTQCIPTQRGFKERLRGTGKRPARGVLLLLPLAAFRAGESGMRAFRSPRRRKGGDSNGEIKVLTKALHPIACAIAASVRTIKQHNIRV